MAGHETCSSWSKGKLWIVCYVECSAWLTVGIPVYHHDLSHWQNLGQSTFRMVVKRQTSKGKVSTATAFSTTVSDGAGEARSDCQAASWDGGTCNQRCHFMLVVWRKAGKMVLWEYSKSDASRYSSATWAWINRPQHALFCCRSLVLAEEWFQLCGDGWLWPSMYEAICSRYGWLKPDDNFLIPKGGKYLNV